VLLTANVAFLAIPGIGNSTQLASFFSTVTSIGSIVIGLLLVRKHRNKPEDSADNVVGHFIYFIAPTPFLTAIGLLSLVGSISPKSAQPSDRLRNARDSIQSTVFIAHVVVSLHELVIFA
jgi:hypothetical protein